MNVLLLGVMPSPLKSIVETGNCNVLETDKVISVDYLRINSIDFVVSYRYRHIIKRNVLECMKDRIINLHISLLPWNRGADPNLWSFLEDTPKGITIHYMDEGIDTGDIIAQQRVEFDMEHETLSSSYHKLNEKIIQLFSKNWPLITKGKVTPQNQPLGGTVHLTADKYRFQHFLDKNGWDTPVKELIGQAFEIKRRRVQRDGYKNQ